MLKNKIIKATKDRTASFLAPVLLTFSTSVSPTAVLSLPLADTVFEEAPGAAGGKLADGSNTAAGIG
jgi:hypothetical protein